MNGSILAMLCRIVGRAVEGLKRTEFSGAAATEGVAGVAASERIS
jgi:hypothetical protein